MRGVVAVGLLTSLVLVGFAHGATAETTSGNTDGDRAAVQAAGGYINPASGGGGGPVCDWDPFTHGDLVELNVLRGRERPPLGADELAENWEIDLGGIAHHMYRVTCPGQETETRFVNPNVTAEDLFGLIVDEASRQIPIPQHDMNPAPEHGTVANLGLWLAVEAQQVDSITAEAGTAWITASPRLVNVSWDMGNGDRVDCGGLGEPYPWNDDPGEGPCGYTYEGSSAKGSYAVTATTRWEIPYASSSGSGSLDPIETSTTWTYDVDEVQTVGTGRG